MVDKRVGLVLQLVACAAAVAFIADEWSDHTLRSRVREWFADRTYIEPEPGEVQPGPGDVEHMMLEANRLTREGA